jgi:type 1 fimbria pilin
MELILALAAMIARPVPAATVITTTVKQNCQENVLLVRYQHGPDVESRIEEVSINRKRVGRSEIARANSRIASRKNVKIYFSDCPAYVKETSNFKIFIESPIDSPQGGIQLTIYKLLNSGHLTEDQ